MPDLIITEALVERCARAMYEATVANAGPHRAKFDALPAYWRKTLATLTPPQPEPQPGEVWEVTLDDGSKVTARAAAALSGSVCLYPLGAMSLPHGPTLPRRRLLTADREWVGGES